MKLAAIYNVFDGVELLRGSMMQLKSRVDLFIIVYQDISNFGEAYNPLPDMDLSGFNNLLLIKYEPKVNGGAINEAAKRNLGLEYAKQHNCTHFMHVDCDEYYNNFDAAVEEYIYKNVNGGSVCKILTYFKLPTLRFENYDNYYVPFIHKLNSDTVAGSIPYPYYVDPTRRINETNVVLLNHCMHHFSWVRKDIEMKIRNSSANLARSPKLLADYLSKEATPGYYVDGFHQKLMYVSNIFNIEI